MWYWLVNDHRLTRHKSDAGEDRNLVQLPFNADDTSASTRVDKLCSLQSKDPSSYQHDHAIGLDTQSKTETVPSAQRAESRGEKELKGCKGLKWERTISRLSSEGDYKYCMGPAGGDLGHPSKSVTYLTCYQYLLIRPTLLQHLLCLPSRDSREHSVQWICTQCTIDQWFWSTSTRTQTSSSSAVLFPQHLFRPHTHNKPMRSTKNQSTTMYVTQYI